MRDAQASVPSARRLRAQLAFKNSMVHGILQFTPSIAFRYVLHRCESRDIRCRESFEDWISRHLPLHFSHRGRRKRKGTHASIHLFFPWRLPRLGFVFRKEKTVLTGSPTERWSKGERDLPPLASPLNLDSRVHRSFCWAGFDNDPSAGSPTETLLRLLLPLNDKVQWTSRDVTGGEPPASPRSEHFTGPFNR